MIGKITKLILPAVLGCLPSSIMAQTTSTLTVEVKAVTGVSTQGLTVELFGEESGWVFDPVKVNANGIAKFSYVPEGVFTLTVDGSPLGLEKYIDANLEHNGVQTVEVMLKEAVRTPYALNAVLFHDDFTGANSVTASWNRETDYFFDDFESYEPFSIDFAPWTGYDLDKEPAAEIMGSYPNRGLQQYATIFNALTIDPPVYYEYEVLRPYSGKQYVGFVRTRSGNANNDWLISPRIKVGVDNIVSFMAKGSEYQPDRFAVCISTTGSEIKDFIQLTPGNYQTVDYKGWKEITYNLSAYEGKDVYIAIHCMSQNSFMLMVDDFYVGPASLASKAKRVSRRSASNPNETFILTLDGREIARTDDYSYTFQDVSAGRHTIGVKAKYIMAESEMESTEIDVPSASEYVSLSINVTDELRQAIKDETISLLNTESAKLTTVRTDVDGKATVGSIAKGQYMLNMATDLYDDYNSTIELTADTSLDIVLKETIVDPYNLTYEISEGKDGSHDVELRWNQDLGFRDSFEDYDDFTQQIGDWTVIDGDRMPTYAFSIAGVIITKPESRGEVGAMVFNPYSTEPVQASEDGLFIAPDGDKYIMFNSAEQALSNDWLISPTLKIGEGYVLRFSAKSYTDMYAGSFDFCALRDKDVTGAEVLDSFRLSSEWMRYEISLDAYKGENIEIGFHHNTFDGWLSFIDDIYVGPDEESGAATPSASNCTFDVYLDNQKYGNVKEPYIRFEGLKEGEHTAGIEALYATGHKSNRIEITFNVDSNGLILIDADTINENVRYYNLQGVEVAEPGNGVYIKVSGGKAKKRAL